MEALWIFPLYFVFPIVGIILLISGVLRFIKQKEKTRIIAGLVLVLLPILHLILMEITQNNFEKDIVGDYVEKGKNETILKIKDDGTFQLEKNPELKKAGVGKWDIYRWDFVELDLHFINSQESEVSFEIMEEDDTIKLSSNPFNDSDLVLIKK